MHYIRHINKIEPQIEIFYSVRWKYSGNSAKHKFIDEFYLFYCLLLLNLKSKGHYHYRHFISVLTISFWIWNFKKALFLLIKSNAKLGKKLLEKTTAKSFPSPWRILDISLSCNFYCLGGKINHKGALFNRTTAFLFFQFFFFSPKSPLNKAERKYWK